MIMIGMGITIQEPLKSHRCHVFATQVHKARQQKYYLLSTAYGALSDKYRLAHELLIPIAEYLLR
jgi:hypothetical protein